MYVLERALHARWAGVLFAIFTAIAAFGIGNMAQSNAIADMLVAKKLDLFLNYPDSTIKLWVGLILSIATGLVILGGIRSISNFCQVLVPLMAIFYVLGCLILLASNWERIPSTLSLILSSAFTGQAAVGGFVGAGIAEAMRFGIARGLFSNESGLGSAPIVAAAAQTKDPVRQALVSSTGTFWDTVVVCAMTGLVIVSSGHWSDAGLTKATLCQHSFQQLGHFGSIILVGGLLTFVFSTIIGWGYYGEKALEYLFGIRAIPPYRWLWILMVFLGAVWKSESVWNLSDIMNGLMALPNIASLLLLGGVVANETNRYFSAKNKALKSPSR